MNATTDRTLHSKVFRRYLASFLRTLLLYTAVFAVVFAFVYLWGTNRIWYADDLLYIPLSILRNNAPLFAVLCWTIFLLPLVMLQWWRIAKDITGLAGSIGKIAINPSTPVELPPALSDVEMSLWQVQMDMQMNEERAREAEQRKNDLVLYLAHDLKTPLTSVLGYLTLLRDQQNIDPDLRAQYLTIATSKAQRLEDLINEFFEITRFNLKGLALEPTRFSLSRLLEQVNDEFRPLYAEKNLTSVVDISPGVEVYADAGKLERVVDNLLRNAVNYSHANSELKLRLCAEAGTAVIEVENRGDTIPSHKLSHIFEQFYRLDSSRSTEGGAGLGLAIAHEIVEKHGGTISAQSADETILFRVALPQDGAGSTAAVSRAGEIRQETVRFPKEKQQDIGT